MNFAHYLACLLALLPSLAWAFAPGDTVRLTKGETLLFQGKTLQTGFKGQEFTVLRHDPFAVQVYVSYYKEDGALTAATLPAKLLEAAPTSPWTDLQRGAELFRDGRLEDAAKVLTRAGQEAKCRSFAQALLPRVTGAAAAMRQGAGGRPALATICQALRELAATWAGEGMLSFALAVDTGVDRLGANLPSKLDRATLQTKVTESTRAVARARQAIGFKRLHEATTVLKAGLEQEPEHPELKTLQAQAEKALKEADQAFADADRMRRFPKGAPHALTALDRGLKVCLDHPQLRA